MSALYPVRSLSRTVACLLAWARSIQRCGAAVDKNVAYIVLRLELESRWHIVCMRDVPAASGPV